MKEGSPNIVKGSAFALIAFFCMAVFGILTKLALQDGSFIWVSFIAYLAGTVALVPFIDFSSLRSNHYSFLISRAVVGTLASFCYTISINYIPIVNGTLLFNTAPIFIPILALIFLNAKIAKSTWLAVLIGFIGIVVIIKPTSAIFTQTGNLIGLLSGMSLAVAYLIMKLLTATDPGWRIIFYYLGIGTLLQIPLLPFAKVLPSLESSLYSMCAGLFLLIAQLALVNSYKYAMASQVGIYQYASVAFVGLLSWIIFGSVPTMGELLGILLVVIAGTIIIRSGIQKNTA